MQHQAHISLDAGLGLCKPHFCFASGIISGLQTKGLVSFLSPSVHHPSVSSTQQEQSFQQQLNLGCSFFQSCLSNILHTKHAAKMPMSFLTATAKGTSPSNGRQCLKRREDIIKPYRALEADLKRVFRMGKP